MLSCFYPGKLVNREEVVSRRTWNFHRSERNHRLHRAGELWELTAGTDESRQGCLLVAVLQG